MTIIATATSKYIRMSPNKLNRVAKLIRGKGYLKSLKILKENKKLASKPIYKTLCSAVSNATNKENIDKEELIIQEIFVNKGAVLKRGRPRAQGRMFKILKRTSHLTIKIAFLVNNKINIKENGTENTSEWV